MERIGYDFTKGFGLNFGRGKRTLLHSFVPKGKDPDYYHKTRKGLGYVTTPVSPDSESEKEAIMRAHQQRHRTQTQHRRYLRKSLSEYTSNQLLRG